MPTDFLQRIIRRVPGRPPVCDNLREHPGHDGCLGLLDAPCERVRNDQSELTDWHGPHNPEPGQLCRGLGLGAICAHGEQALNECDYC